MPKKSNEQKIVSWFIIKKSLIKFEGEEDSISVSDKVMSVSDFEKYPIGKGDTVEVGIKDDEVAFLRKVKVEKSAKSETKKEETKTDVTDKNSEVKKVTIFAVAGNKKVVKFEKDGQWIKVSTDVQKQDFSDIGLLAGNLVSVTLVNEEIASVKKEEETEKVSETKSTEIVKTKTKSSYRDESAMDKRTAIMCAKDIAVALINNGTVDKTKISEAIEALSKKFYKALTEL